MNRTSDILWLEPSNNRRQATATVHEDGTLRFGSEMCEKLVDKIRIGFMQNECALFVEKNTEKGFKLRKNGKVRMTSITAHLRRLGIDFPVWFLFSEEIESTCWKVYVIQPLRSIPSAKLMKVTPVSEHQSLINAYKWLIDRALYCYAKSTPIDERRSTATEAFWEAFCDYLPSYGLLKDYLSDNIKRRLIEHNKQYTLLNQYNCISLDRSDDRTCKNGESNYNWLLDRFRSEITDAENRIDLEKFKITYLDPSEKRILEMLLTGYTVPEILDEQNITQQRIEDTCRSIGERWNAYNDYDDDPAA